MENNNGSQPTSNTQSYCNAVLKWYQNNSKTIRGFVALSLGLFALFYTRQVVINLFIFLTGVVCIYYGLSLLGVTHITTIIEKLVGKIKD